MFERMIVNNLDSGLVEQVDGPASSVVYNNFCAI